LSARSDEFWRFVYVQQGWLRLASRSVPLMQAPANFNLTNIELLNEGGTALAAIPIYHCSMRSKAQFCPRNR
jgi:hypothetical protein